MRDGASRTDEVTALTKGQTQKPRKPMRRKKPVVLKTSEALDRLIKMMPLIRANIEQALRIEATLEAGNKIVGEMQDREFPGARAYNVIKASLGFDLALHLARLFDARPVRYCNRKSGKLEYVGRHPNARDEASIPLMIRLLRQKRCRDALIERARSWHPTHDECSKRLYAADCEKAIGLAVEGYGNLYHGRFGRSGLGELKKMRDTAIAHSSIKPAEWKVIYNHLFRLVDDACKIVEVANVAIAGYSPDLQRLEEEFEEEANEFWERALLGTQRGAEITDQLYDQSAPLS
ncbi:hypothetical protein ACQZ4X_21785 [Agrobacterium vitis]